jgi:hypothetical protein
MFPVFIPTQTEHIIAIFKTENFLIWRPLGASHWAARQLATPLHVTKRGGESE